eukprot:7170295-Prymnesium_polylepis.1
MAGAAGKKHASRYARCSCARRTRARRRARRRAAALSALWLCCPKRGAAPGATTHSQSGARA